MCQAADGIYQWCGTPCFTSYSILNALNDLDDIKCYKVAFLHILVLTHAPIKCGQFINMINKDECFLV